MDVVLNESTETVHRPDGEASGLHTACGVARTMSSERLEIVPLGEATREYDVSRCGRCFEAAGGY